MLKIAYEIVATQSWRKKFAVTAKAFPRLRFAVADEDQNKELFNEFGFDESGEEINVGLIDEKNKKYSMKPQEEYDAGVVDEFLNNYLKGAYLTVDFLTLFEIDIYQDTER